MGSTAVHSSNSHTNAGTDGVVKVFPVGVKSVPEVFTWHRTIDKIQQDCGRSLSAAVGNGGAKLKDNATAPMKRTMSEGMMRFETGVVEYASLATGNTFTGSSSRPATGAFAAWSRTIPCRIRAVADLGAYELEGNNSMTTRTITTFAKMITALVKSANFLVAPGIRSNTWRDTLAALQAVTALITTTTPEVLPLGEVPLEVLPLEPQRHFTPVVTIRTAIKAMDRYKTIAAVAKRQTSRIINNPDRARDLPAPRSGLHLAVAQLEATGAVRRDVNVGEDSRELMNLNSGEVGDSIQPFTDFKSTG
ncbi:MAG: hypothetical protein Q9202_000434 [Teloschistes flavicans]